MALAQAFKNKSFDSQHCFRAILESMSEPGVIKSLERSEGFGIMSPAMAQVAQTLADTTTPIMLSDSLGQDTTVLENMRFYVESPLVDSPDNAVFFLTTLDEAQSDIAHLKRFPVGTHEYPELGTTFVIDVPSFESGAEFCLSGPGIKDSRTVCLGDVQAEFTTFLQNRTPHFPLGWDFIFTCGHIMWALPRTTKIEVL